MVELKKRSELIEEQRRVSVNPFYVNDFQKWFLSFFLMFSCSVIGLHKDDGTVIRECYFFVESLTLLYLVF
jgi:hypothetical protein